MDKKSFLAELSKGLSGLSYEEQDKWLDFYSEMIDDRMEDGLSQEEAVAAIGSVEDVVAQILSQQAPEKKQKTKRELKGWHVALLIVGSPIWFSLLIAAACVVFSLLVTVWAVVIAFYAVSVSLMVCSLAGIALMLLYLFHGNPIVAVFCFGASLLCSGLGIFWFIGTHYMTKGVIWLCKKLFAALIPRKETNL